MAEEKTSAGGVTITTGEKDLGTKALESSPLVGNAVKAFGAGAKLTDGATQSEVSGLMSEGSGFIQSLSGAALGIATDPIGWLVGQGLSFLISVCQPLEDAIHFVSGDGPALSQAAGNFAEIGKGVEKLRGTFEEDLSASLKEWGGDAAEAAGTKLGEFAKGIDGVAAQAGDVSHMLQMSSMVMTVIEDFIKALLTEFITWLIMIWVPALASAVFTAGGSTAAAGAATAGKAASTGGRVSRAISKLRKVFDEIIAFLKKLGSNIRNLKGGFRKALSNQRALSSGADDALAAGSKSPISKFLGKEGEFGSRVNDGFGKSIKDAAVGTAQSEVGVGTGPGAGPDKLLRNQSSAEAAEEADNLGADYSTEETNRYLDI